MYAFHKSFINILQDAIEIPGKYFWMSPEYLYTIYIHEQNKHLREIF